MCNAHVIQKKHFFYQDGVEVRVARIFNTFGPRMHMNDGRVVSNFILQALQGQNITVRDLTDYYSFKVMELCLSYLQLLWTDVKKISQIILTIHEEVSMHVHLSMVFFLIASTQYSIDE